MMNSCYDNYYRANSLLEKRIKQLLSRGNIVIHSQLKSRFGLKKEGDSSEVDFDNDLVLYGLGGTKETVNSSNDWVVKKIYKMCCEYKIDCEFEGDTILIRHFEKIISEERSLYKKIDDKKFVG